MEKRNKIALFGNIVLAILIAISDIVFMLGVLDKYIIKTLASALFVFCGAFNLVLAFKFNGENKYKSVVMLLGLIFAFVGDVVLIDNFILGAIFFAVGHLFFLAYFILLSRLTYIDAIVMAIIFSCSLALILLFPFEFDGMKALVIIYAFIISLMLSKAVSNYILNRTLANLIILIGASLFFFSDVMLLFNVFTNISNVFDYLCLATYYPGEFLLGLSIYFQAFYTIESKNL